MLTARQKYAAQAIVTVFETGRPAPDYAAVACLPGDAGQLSYGRAQFSLASGSLALLLRDYIAAEDAAYAETLAPWLEAAMARDSVLNDDIALRVALADAGQDPVMCRAQDAMLDRLYWQPAVKIADRYGFIEPLSSAVIYDGCVHGSFWPRAHEASEAVGEPHIAGERQWVLAYLSARRDWLSNHRNTLLRHTAYRPRALRLLADDNNWRLDLPFNVRGVVVSEKTLTRIAGKPPVAARLQEDAYLLCLTDPPMRSPAISQCAAALMQAGFPVPQTDIYNSEICEQVRRFQQNRGLLADGIIGPATRAELFAF